MKRTGIAILAVVLFVLPPAIAQAQEDGGDGSKTIVLTDPDHPLNGAWQYMHAAGTVVCPSMTVAIPAGNPETVRIAVHDAGARLEITSKGGHMTMQRADAIEWESETPGEMQILRRKLSSDNAHLMARAVDGYATIYEGTQTPAAGMTIRYIMGWSHDSPDKMSGHITSDFQGCKVLRAFEASRGG